MKKLFLALPIAAVALALTGPAAPSGADENELGRCPDGYVPVLFLFSTAEDRNGNGVVCVKPRPNGTIIEHDDPNGQPYACNGTFSMSNPGCWAAVTDDLVEN